MIIEIAQEEPTDLNAHCLFVANRQVYGQTVETQQINVYSKDVADMLTKLIAILHEMNKPIVLIRRKHNEPEPIQQRIRDAREGRGNVRFLRQARRRGQPRDTHHPAGKEGRTLTD